ncbi:MAG: tRNA 2-thiocytidine biosynthesis TtcA family protein [Negativicutes bacterium]|jgi:tRNA 2-thiocytidine biosynthesis protein TtcA
MHYNLPQKYFSRIMRAVIEFDLIEDGDKILIGLSGGKDSLFLTYALAMAKKHMPVKFELSAITIDPMFTDDFETSALANFCQSLEVPFYTEKVDISGVINNNNGKDPCFSCSFFRRGAINKFAVNNGFNKIAYAHHHDDAVETFFMALLNSGQLKTFLPKTYLDRTKLTVIRPLIYFREHELKETPALHGFTPLPSPCPLDGKTKRQEIKELIQSLSKIDADIYDHLTSGMRISAVQELWPAPIDRDQMLQKHIAFWKTQKNVYK